MQYGRDALRHDDDGGAAGLSLERAAQGYIGLVVQRREAVIKQIDLRVLGNGARNRKALLLPARDIAAALCDGAGKALRLGGNEIGSLCDLSGLLHIGIGDVVAAELEVGVDRAAEQHTLLGHIAKAVVQLRLGQLAYIHTADGHTACRCIVKARDQVEQR